MTDKLILGTVQLGIPYGINNSSGKPDAARAAAILDCARNGGISTLDTAKAYGDAMGVIGKYHSDSNFCFRVISKFHAGSETLEQDIDQELSLLNISQFEAYLFHSFQDFEKLAPATEKIITQLKAAGLIKKIGVSVYGNDQFEKAINSSIVDLIQFPYNLLDNDRQRAVLIEKAKRAGKELHVRSVFLQGLFFMEAEAVPQKIKPLLPYLEQIKALAASEQLSTQELALLYVLQNKNIDKVLIGVDSAEQLEKNLHIAKIGKLSDKLRDKINAIQVAETELLSPVNWN